MASRTRNRRTSNEEEEEEEQDALEEGEEEEAGNAEEIQAAYTAMMGPNGKFIQAFMAKHGLNKNQAMEQFRVGFSTHKAYVYQFAKVVKFWFEKSKTTLDGAKSLIDNVENLVEQKVNATFLHWAYLCITSLQRSFSSFAQGMDLLVGWTKEYCGQVSELAKSGGGESTLDKASAACTFFMCNIGLENPFLRTSVSNVRKAIRRITSLAGTTKKKAGALLFDLHGP